MTILVTCKCGKQFRAEDDHAGMEANCPACNQPLTIPGSRPGEPPPPPLPTTTSDDGEVVASKSRSVGSLLTAMIILVLVVLSGLAYQLMKGGRGEISEANLDEITNQDAPSQPNTPEGSDEPTPESISEEELEQAPTPIASIPQEPEPEGGTSAPKLSGEPLPNGVVFDHNLSLGIAKIERKGDTATVWLAFRKVGERWPVSCWFTLKVIDDRANQYTRQFSIGNARSRFRLNGEPPDLRGLPTGFTWVDSVDIEVPKMAPIHRTTLGRKLSTSKMFGPLPGAEEVDLELDLTKPSYPNLVFEIEPPQLLAPEDEVRLDEDVSFRLEDIKVKGKFSGRYGGSARGFDISVNLCVKNSDYNPSTFPPMILVIQLDDGQHVIPEGMWGLRGTEIPGLSEQALGIGNDIVFNLREEIDTLPVPRLLVLYTEHSIIGGYRFFRFVRIPERLQQKLLRIRDAHLVVARARRNLEKWAERNLSRRIDHGFGLPSQIVVVKFHDFSVVGKNVWAVGNLQKYGGHGRLVHSADGGKTWETQWSAGEDGGEVRLVDFFDENEGLLVTSRGMLKTSNAGKSWAHILTVTNIPGLRFFGIQVSASVKPGGPGRLPARGSHRPERAQLTHSVPQVIRSLRRGTPSGPPAGKAQGNAPRVG